MKQNQNNIHEFLNNEQFNILKTEVINSLKQDEDFSQNLKNKIRKDNRNDIKVFFEKLAVKNGFISLFLFASFIVLLAFYGKYSDENGILINNFIITFSVVISLKDLILTFYDFSLYKKKVDYERKLSNSLLLIVGSFYIGLLISKIPIVISFINNNETIIFSLLLALILVVQGFKNLTCYLKEKKQ